MCSGAAVIATWLRGAADLSAGGEIAASLDQQAAGCADSRAVAAVHTAGAAAAPTAAGSPAAVTAAAAGAAGGGLKEQSRVTRSPT